MQAADQETMDLYERILSAAFRRLVQMDRPDAAFPLLDAVITGIDVPSRGYYAKLSLVLGAESFDAFTTADFTEYEDEEWGTQKREGLYRQVFETVVPHDIKLGSVEPRIRLDPVEVGWREAAYGALKGGSPNQGNLVSQGAITYNGRFYRSADETILARELDRLAILYFPLPTASRAGVLKEPDLVVVYKGKIGIVEVDGHYHTGRAADDHKRDLFFEQSGIFVKHFNGDDVRSNARLVVETFLKLLSGQTR
jgi:hypothetical protein